MPADRKPDKRRQKALDATWTKGHGKSHFGSKLSVNVDRMSKVIRKIETDTASTHDGRPRSAVPPSQEVTRAQLQRGEQPEAGKTAVHDQQIVTGQMREQRGQQRALTTGKRRQGGLEHQTRGRREQPQGPRQDIGLTTAVERHAECVLVR